MGEILRLFVSETTLFVFPSSGGPDELFEVVHCLLVKRNLSQTLLAIGDVSIISYIAPVHFSSIYLSA